MIEVAKEDKADQKNVKANMRAWGKFKDKAATAVAEAKAFIPQKPTKRAKTQ